jgi:predicted ester cyclase
MISAEVMDAAGLVRQLQEAANAHDAPRLGDFYSEDAVAISPVFGEVHGRREVVRTFEALFETYPDCVFELSEAFAEGNRFAFMGSVTATDNRGWFGLPPTGSIVRYRITMVCTVVGDKIVREERLYDLTGIVERLEKARIEAELRLASEVQSALLPPIAKAPAGRRSPTPFPAERSAATSSKSSSCRRASSPSRWGTSKERVRRRLWSAPCSTGCSSRTRRTGSDRPRRSGG